MMEQSSKQNYVLYIGEADVEIDLEPLKVYRVVEPENNDPHGYLRIIDESGEDYLYPEDWFTAISLPRDAQAAIQRMSEAA